MCPPPSLGAMYFPSINFALLSTNEEYSEERQAGTSLLPTLGLFSDSYMWISGLCFLGLSSCKPQKFSISLKVIYSIVIHYLHYTSNKIFISIIIPPFYTLVGIVLQNCAIKLAFSGVLVSIHRKEKNRMCIYQSTRNLDEIVLHSVDLGTTR